MSLQPVNRATRHGKLPCTSSASRSEARCIGTQYRAVATGKDRDRERHFFSARQRHTCRCAQEIDRSLLHRAQAVCERDRHPVDSKRCSPKLLLHGAGYSVAKSDRIAVGATGFGFVRKRRCIGEITELYMARLPMRSSVVAADAGVAATKVTDMASAATNASDARKPPEIAFRWICMIVLLSWGYACASQTDFAGALAAAAVEKRGAMNPQMMYVMPSTSMPPSTASLPEA